MTSTECTFASVQAWNRGPMPHSVAGSSPAASGLATCHPSFKPTGVPQSGAGSDRAIGASTSRSAARIPGTTPQTTVRLRCFIRPFPSGLGTACLPLPRPRPICSPTPTETASMAEIPAAFHSLLTDKRAFAHLATTMKDGSPQVTPVWFDYSNGRIRVNTAKGRVKARNMTEGSRVALSILDPDNAYRYLQIRGTVARVTETGGVAHIDSLAKKYLNKDVYPWRDPKQTRVIYEITPSATQAMG